MSKQKFTKEELKERLNGNELDLGLCNLSKVPVREITSLPKATMLDLSCNVLTTLPPTFSTLTQLTKLDLSKNNLVELPNDFGQLVNLERLDLYSNKLSNLPVSCYRLKQLNWLDLKGNPIQALLPDVVGNCLTGEECKRCAINIISYLKKENAEQERLKQRHLQAEREEKAAEDAQAIKERELRKRRKLVEKEERRAAFQEMERQKIKMTKEDDHETILENNCVKDEADLEKKTEIRKGRASLVLYTFILIGLVVSLGLLFYGNKKVEVKT